MMGKVIVYHRGYGCDTGCCGHTVEIYADDVVAGAGEDFAPYFYDSISDDSVHNFEFAHPYGSDEAGRLAFAQDMVRSKYGEEHVKDLDWEHCIVTDDCT